MVAGTEKGPCASQGVTLAPDKSFFFSLSLPSEIEKMHILIL